MPHLDGQCAVPLRISVATHGASFCSLSLTAEGIVSFKVQEAEAKYFPYFVYHLGLSL